MDVKITMIKTWTAIIATAAIVAVSSLVNNNLLRFGVIVLEQIWLMLYLVITYKKILPEQQLMHMAISGLGLSIGTAIGYFICLEIIAATNMEIYSGFEIAFCNSATVIGIWFWVTFLPNIQRFSGTSC